MAWAASAAGWLAVQFVGRTSRLRTRVSPALRDRLDKGLPVIYAFWHRHQILMLFQHRCQGVHVLVSQSRDGEIVAQALERFGFRTVRGSSSRGGGAAFMKLVEIVRAGGRVAITPDGPRGPYRSIGPGIQSLSARTGAPVVPVAWAGSRVKELKTWDRFLIPLPFGRYEVVFGEPMHIPGGPAGQEALRAALDAVEREAASRLVEA